MNGAGDEKKSATTAIYVSSGANSPESPKSPPNSPNANGVWSSRVMRRPPSLVWEGIAGAATDHIWLQTSPNTTTSISVTNTSIPGQK